MNPRPQHEHIQGCVRNNKDLLPRTDGCIGIQGVGIMVAIQGAGVSTKVPAIAEAANVLASTTGFKMFQQAPKPSKLAPGTKSVINATRFFIVVPIAALRGITTCNFEKTDPIAHFMIAFSVQIS